MSIRTSRKPAKSDKATSLNHIKGKRAKKPLASRYIDDEAEESLGEISDTFGSVDPDDLEEEDLTRSSKKSAFQQEVLSSSEEDMEAMAGDDSMFAAPSFVDRRIHANRLEFCRALPPAISTRRNKRGQQELSNGGVSVPNPSKKSKGGTVVAQFVTTLITDLFKQQNGPVSTPLGEGTTRSEVRAVERPLVRVPSPTPDVEDPIDYEAAEMAQAISDSVVTANAIRSKLAIAGTSDGSLGNPSKARERVPDVAGSDNETTAENIMKEYAMAASDPVTIAAGAAYFDKVAAPHLLAARQAMDIKDHMERPLKSSSKGILSSDVSVPGDLQAALAAPSNHTMGQFMGIKSVAYAEPPVNLGMVLSDLETYKAKYDPETPCGVADPDLQDPVLRQTYLGLPPLPSGKKLLPSFVQQNDLFNYSLSGGHVAFSLWGGRIPNMNFHNSVGSVLFVDAPGCIINPSRVDPRRIASQATSPDLSRYLLVIDGKTALCVSSVMSTDSVLSAGRSFGRSRPRKWLSGLFHNQEYERFVSFMCLAFGASTMYAQLLNAAVTFQTALGPLPGGGSGNDITKTGVVSPQKGFVSSSVVRTSLAFEDEGALFYAYISNVVDVVLVPVYDGRTERINFKTDLGRLASILPKFDGEIPFGSFVTVGYTATMWSAIPSASTSTDKTKRPHLGCNIMWAIVVGVP
ncbi:hypothetical protein B0H11DRAFT_1919809 [Mycena galericulata]|nr:hypothetical protein B0H11DRAFT_1919809 [Mycena galericulata]